MNGCCVALCQRPHYARGYCLHHYRAARAAGAFVPRGRRQPERPEPNPAHLAALRRHAALIRHATAHNDASCPRCRLAVALVETIAGVGRPR